MFQTTRRRLALWYTTVTAILLLLFATGVYFYVRSTLIERIDDTLNHVVEVMQRSIVIEPVNPHSEGGPLRVNVEASFRNNAATGEDDRIDLEWFSSTGELLWSTLAAPLNLPLHPDRAGETVQIDPTPLLPHSPTPLLLRQVTHRLQVGRYVLGYLRVSHPWFEVTKPTRELFFDLILGTGLMVAAVGAIGWFLSGLAMEPVRESYQRLKQFTSDASHELRSPIAIIQTNVQVALADPDPDPENQQYHLRVVERLTRRLGRLVDDLLFLARQDSGIVQPRWATVSLEGLLRDVVEEQQSLAEEKGIALVLAVMEPKSVETKTEAKTEVKLALTPAIASPLSELPALASDWANLEADRDQLARLFTNLVGNALQYTPTGGRVTVGMQRLGRSGAYSFQVTVSDTGIGIAPESLPRLFDRFYRVDPARTQGSAAGSGLGLAIAQAIVETHQGQIQIDSALERGTIVNVTLPKLP